MGLLLCFLEVEPRLAEARVAMDKMSAKVDSILAAFEPGELAMES